MGLGTVISGIFSKGATDLASVAFNGLDELITSKEEKGEQVIKLEEIKSVNAKNRMDFQLASKNIEYKITDQEYKDRQSAREMYMKDSSLQKIFAIVFLVGYIVLSVAMVLIVFGFFGVVTLSIDAFQASIISMVFTGMSMKVNTITDFLFGGSKGKDDSDARVAQAFKESKE